MPITLAFDLGASSGRCVVGRFERDRLSVSELCRFPNDPVSVRGDLHWDLLRLWHEIKAGISRAAIGPEGASIGIDTWGVDFGLVDRAGRLLGHPYHYRDQRTHGMIERAEARVGRGFLFRTTGVHDHWVNTVYQLLAQQECDPRVLEQADRLLFMPDLFHFFLTGIRANEYTIASTSQLLGAGRAEWSRTVLEALGLPVHPFGRIVPPGTVLGLAEARIRRELGAQGELGVIAVGAHDTASAVASVPAAAGSGWAFVSSGTWSIVGVEREQPCLSAECDRLGFSNEGGIGGKTRLVKNLTGLWLVQECRRQWEREGETVGFAELSQAAREARPFVAHIDGDSPAFTAPGNLPQRIADVCAATGQRVPETRGELVRSILESIAFKYRVTLEQLEALTGERIDVVHLVGGGVSDELLCQFAANATGRPVLAGPVEATAIGNTIVQLMARGYVASLAEARRIVLGSFPPREYLPSDQASWERAYAAFLADLPPATPVSRPPDEPNRAGLGRSGSADVERFFQSPEVTLRKDEICDIGRRLWQRAYVDGNGGNISIRVAHDLVLCTPTLVSKGFMRPADLCLVDMQGAQKAGAKQRTSEILMHLAIYRAVPEAMACVHAHPPYATGFAVAGVSPPSCLVPEMEVFCGEVPIAPYMTPGSPQMGEAVAALAPTHNTILMANHGVVAWSKTVEDTYFKLEILEAYCRAVVVAARLGKPPNTIPARQVRELLTLKRKLGIPDPRYEFEESELRDNSAWRPGEREAEELVRRITDAIGKVLGG